MVITLPEKKMLATQRRIRRLRQQRLFHANGHMPNGNGTLHTNGATEKPRKQLLVKDLGWTREEALETHYRLRNFARVWDGPGIEEYDEM